MRQGDKKVRNSFEVELENDFSRQDQSGKGKKKDSSGLKAHQVNIEKTQIKKHSIDQNKKKMNELRKSVDGKKDKVNKEDGDQLNQQTRKSNLSRTLKKNETEQGVQE